jgi:hypothetical protein
MVGPSFQKPLVPAKLVQMVTDVLHSRNRSQLGGQEFDSRKDILKDSLTVTPRHDDDFASCGFRTSRASQDIATGKLEEDGEIPTIPEIVKNWPFLNDHLDLIDDYAVALPPKICHHRETYHGMRGNSRPVGLIARP